MKRFAIGAAEVGGPRLLVIAGPCVVESADLCLKVAGVFTAYHNQHRGLRFRHLA